MRFVRLLETERLKILLIHRRLIAQRVHSSFNLKVKMKRVKRGFELLARPEKGLLAVENKEAFYRTKEIPLSFEKKTSHRLRFVLKKATVRFICSFKKY